MFIIVENRELVVDGFTALFKREGVCALGVQHEDFRNWFENLNLGDLRAIEAILIGDHALRECVIDCVRRRSRAPVLALIDGPALEETLRLFDRGFDEVLRKPVHVREIIARVGMIGRRLNQVENDKPISDVSNIRVYADGREPEIFGTPLTLPRRERRILEYLASNAGRRVTKSQLFAAIYGIDDGDIDETVVESHVSKLRKKLRGLLGYDPINSQRFLGYCLQFQDAPMAKRSAQAIAA